MISNKDKVYSYKKKLGNILYESVFVFLDKRHCQIKIQEGKPSDVEIDKQILFNHLQLKERPTKATFRIQFSNKILFYTFEIFIKNKLSLNYNLYNLYNLTSTDDWKQIHISKFKESDSTNLRSSFLFLSVPFINIS